jgi:hypothetical protein
MRRDFEWAHETVLAAETASASRARDFVCLHLIEHELLYLVEDVRLVVSELATHAVLEGRLPFLVTLQGSDESVLLTVQDGSRGTPGEGEDQVDAQVDAQDHRLAVVESASREWGVRREPDGTRSVWASFEVRWRRSPD